MSTYLQITQKSVRESGTTQSVSPSSVASQTGRLLQFVNWTADAWTWVQNKHSFWRWMRKEFSGKETVSGTARYTAASWSITDFARWREDDIREGYYPLTIYKQATGVSDENYLRQVSYEYWRSVYGRGTQTNDRPSVYAISPLNKICLGPIPDAVYIIGGEYQKTPQVLSDNDDVPECPARFHDIIVWKALIFAAEFDEAPLYIGRASKNFTEMMGQLELDQLAPVVISFDPIA